MAEQVEFPTPKGLGEIHPLRAVPGAIGGVLIKLSDRLPTMLPKVPLASHGDHEPHGAAEMLDEGLYGGDEFTL